MKPTESLIQSRFKECFTIQIRNKWKNFIDSILNSESTQNKLNKFKNYFGRLEIFSENDSGQIVFELEGLPKLYEDVESVEEKNYFYEKFLEFMR